MAIITLAPLALFGILAIINVVIGLCTGFKKSIARLAAIVAAAIIAFIVTLIVCSPTSNLMTTVSGFINEIVAGSAVEEIFAVEALGISISYYISMLVSPFFFTVVFIALSIILSIVAAIVIRLIFRDKKPGPLLNRLGGSLIGLVCAILITSFILTPIVGTISLITPALELDEVKESFAEGEVLTESGVVVRISEVIAVAMDDAPGGAGGILHLLSEAGLNVEYMYACVGRLTGKALMVIRTDDTAAATEILHREGYGDINPAEVSRI